MERPPAKPPITGWKRHFIRRKETLHTTWKLRLSVLILGMALLWATRGLWEHGIAASLTCNEEIGQGDALLLENFDPSYLVFERAARLQRGGFSGRILVPVTTFGGPDTPNPVTKGIAELMANLARLHGIEVVPITEVEPISLNAAKAVRTYLVKEHLTSVTVIAPLFRSRRSFLVYRSVLAPDGIAVRCIPINRPGSEYWSHSWHGIQEAVLQLGKLLYYRLYVLPLKSA